MEKKKNKFLSNKVFVIFGILAILICLVAVFAPQICGDVDPAAGDLTQAIMAPSAEHPFGTDKMGRDIFARVIYGARSSLSVSFADSPAAKLTPSLTLPLIRRLPCGT